ncbi:hypothetical protein FQN52_008544 [Onygenales sp. PD_12]|nr:hypothetical protein FQN52_008544 [Onygenales sp. PD_12]
MKNLTHNDYTVGWVSALPLELAAATAMLDQIHPDLPVPLGDHNTYTLGSIGKHNIVIACLPIGTIGTSSAATVATQMVRTFPSIKVGLLVGIGGGMPPKVRLGDVVVGTPVGQYSGVVQWDMGKAEYGGFVQTGAIDSPPWLLRTALSKLVTNHESQVPKVYQYLDDLGKNWPGLVPRYTWSDSREDPLSTPIRTHGSQSRLQVIIMTLMSYLIGWSVLAPMDLGANRMTDSTVNTGSNGAQRKPGEIGIHYGLIASGNQVIKDVQFRDVINERLGGNVLCFEMEAAGLVDFPCLVIRGICDYADSQKNKDWQEYAAMVAAAYARELLGYVRPSDVDMASPVKERVDQIFDTVSRIEPDVLRIQTMLSHDEDIKILDWLAPDDYETQHNIHFSERQQGTGLWLLENAQFKTWATTKEQTLFCPGIPGAGKTILTSIVIDHLEEKFKADPKIGIAYIYCNFKQQDKQKINDLLASVLKQLLVSKSQSSLPESIKKLYDHLKSKQTRPELDKILEVFHSVAAIFSKVFIIIDALDECLAYDRRRFLSELFNLQTQHGVNIFATSRDIPEIVNQFKGNVRLEIRASKEDVVRYLESDMRKKLQPFVQENHELQEEIKTGISEAVDGMFLLAKIYLDLLEDKVTTNDIRESLEAFRKQQGPSGDQKAEALAYAYDQVMERVNGQKPGLKNLAIKILSWITFAKRPLTVSELQHALAIRVGKLDLDEGDLPHIETMTSVCSGLATVDNESNIIRPVHYTTQEYFERTWERWFPNAHNDLTERCVTYLSFERFETGACETRYELDQRLESNVLYDYAAKNWGHHAGKSSIDGGSLILDFLHNTAKSSACGQAMRYEEYGFKDILETELSTSIHLAAYFGLWKSTSTLLEKNVDIDARDNRGRTPLLLAAKKGHEAVVKLLLEKNANVEHISHDGDTALLLAVRVGHEGVVRLLLEKDANTECIDHDGQTPLLWAAFAGSDEGPRLLIKKDIGFRVSGRWVPLLWATGAGNEAVLRLALEAETISRWLASGKDPEIGSKLSVRHIPGDDGNGIALVVSESFDHGSWELRLLLHTLWYFPVFRRALGLSSLLYPSLLLLSNI